MNIQKLDQLEGSELHRALTEHFSYLAPSTEWLPILEAVMSSAREAKYDEQSLEVFFSGNRRLMARPPAARDQYANWPASFQALVQHHEYLSFPEEGWSVSLGEAGNFEPDESEGEALEYHEDGVELLAPLTDFSDWWVFHPEEKTESGEPVLYLFDHGECDFGDRETYHVGALFLIRFAQLLELDLTFPPAPAAKANENSDLRDWWRELAPEWRTYLADELEVKEGETPTPRQLKQFDSAFLSDDITDGTPLTRCAGLGSLYLKNSGITSFDFIGELHRLTQLDISKKPVKNLEFLRNLTQLEQLNIQDTPVTDLEPLTGLLKLDSLNVARTGVSDLSHIRTLSELTTLRLGNTPVDSVEPLRNLSALYSLDLSGTKVDALEPLYNLTRLSSLNVRETDVTLAEIMRMKHHRPDCAVTYSGSDEPEQIVRAVIDLKDITGFETGVFIIAEETLADFVKAERFAEAADLLRALSRFFPLPGDEAALKNKLFVTCLSILSEIGEPDRSELQPPVFEHLAPTEYEDVEIPRRLAAFHARTGNLDSALEYVRITLEQGAEPDSLAADASLESIQGNQAFRDLVRNFDYPNPAKQPLEWWDALPAEWREAFEDHLPSETPSAADIRELLELEEFADSELDNLLPLKHLTKLKSIRLNYGKYTSLRPLSNLSELEELELESNGRIADLAPLAKLHKLKTIRLHETMRKFPITSLEPLRGLAALESFHVLGSSIEDLGPLQNLEKLRVISLNNCKVVDAEPITGLPSLEKVYLGNGRLETVRGFENAPRLNFLFVGGNKVPEAEINALRKKRPEMEVST